MANKVAMHIERKPAQEMQVDYVGDAMGVLDLDTGELLKVYVFAACLPYSGELYAEGFYDMKEESWVEAHVHAQIQLAVLASRLACQARRGRDSRCGY